MKTLSITKKRGARLGLSRFPNFHRSGSIRGMKSRFYGKDAMLVRCGQWIYNVDSETYRKAAVLQFS
jgi:hypothetical protein